MDIEERFRDLLDSSHEPITIGGIEFTPSQILKNCDPIAYRCYLSDFESAEEEEEEGD